MTTEPTHDPLEGALRAMLHRRAADVSARSDVALPSATAVRAGRPYRARALVAVAAGVVLLLGIGAVAVGSGGEDDEGERVVATAPDGSATTRDDATPSVRERDVGGTTAPDETDGPTTTTAGGGASTTSTSGVGPGAVPPTEPGAVDDPPPDDEEEGEPSIVLHSIGVHRSAYGRCDGGVDVTGTTTQIWVERSGSRLAPAVTVPLRVSGTLAAPAPTSVTIPQGSWDGFADVELPAAGPVELAVELLPAAGYTLASPSRQATSDPEPEMVLDCLRPVPADPARGALAQTIDVGQTPEDISFLVEHMGLSWPRVVGGTVPGLTLEHDGDSRAAVAVWSGAATTPGTFTLVVRFCHAHPDQICDGTAHVTIIVRS